jgi:hypothetical protein
MVERICPTCQHGNPLDDRFCGKCGAALERLLPARRSDGPLTIAGRELPVSWRQVGRTVAFGAVALVAEAGFAWLRRRLDAPEAAVPLARKNTATPTTRGGGSVVTIISQRVVEILDSGDGRRKVSERHVWRKIEE